MFENYREVFVCTKEEKAFYFSFSYDINYQVSNKQLSAKVNGNQVEHGVCSKQ